MRRHTSTAIGGALLVIVIAGCTSEEPGAPTAGDRPATPSSSSSVSATTSRAPAAPTTTSPTPAPTRPPLAKPGECGVGDLGVALGASEGATGTLYRALVFTNTGGRTCTIQGFPGVSFVAGDDGHQVGEPAFRVGDKGPVVTLRPGATATSPVGFVNIGAYDTEVCVPTAVRGLRVYPPHERKAEFVPFDTTACAGRLPSHQLTVRTVHEGSGLG